MPLRTVSLIFAAFLSASAADAQTPEAAASANSVAKPGADAPRSGGVDLPTFQARHRARLMRADADHDGRVGAGEWTAWWAAHPGKGPADPEKRFRRLDANGDGFVTAEEIDAVAARRFARLDDDHDGRVTRAERPHRDKRP